MRISDWSSDVCSSDLDEAFADAVPEASVAPACERPGLVVLRSFGKFFGLAGARLGFVLAAPALTERLNAALGPWAVSGPAAEIRSEEHPSELQSLMRISYAVFCLKTKTKTTKQIYT